MAVENAADLEGGALCWQVESVARVHKNTVSHTGLMLWEAAFPLARFILACPSLFNGVPLPP